MTAPSMVEAAPAAPPVVMASAVTTCARVGNPSTVTRSRVRPIEETLPPYTLVLHNDDVNTMDHVVRALLESVPELDIERAAEVMLTAHLRGEADVLSCPLERAELYRDRLRGHGLHATVRGRTE